jgi:hypothetical protein
MLQKLALYDYFFDPMTGKKKALFETRLIFGFLSKRSKGKLKYFHKRWLVLVSPKPLTRGNSLEKLADETILDDSLIPTWMEMDTAYYFNADGQSK